MPPQSEASTLDRESIPSSLRRLVPNWRRPNAARRATDQDASRVSTFSLLLLLMLGTVVLFVASFALAVNAEQQLQRANDTRLRSHLLGEELRQSSNDLTRLVRSYVITGDPAFKEQFDAVRAIRDGNQPRPMDYSPSYWDIYAVEGTAGPIGPAQPLLDVMREAGFTEPELQKLAQAKHNSDRLTEREYQAMALIEMTGNDAAARRARAVEMLHDAAFHRAKVEIMRPIVEFDRMVDERTSTALASAQSFKTRVRTVQIALGIALLGLLWGVYGELHRILGCSVGQLQRTIAKLGAGDFSSQIQVPRNLPDSVLAWVSDTREKLAKMELLQFRAIVNSSEDAIIGKTTEGIITSWNGGAERLFGYTAAEALGRPMAMVIPPERLNEEPEILARIGRGERVEHFETERLRKDGTRIHVSVTISPIRDRSGRVIGASKIARDITRAKQAEAEIHRLAFYDPLTGLPNRRLVLERLEHALTVTRRSQGACAVLFIDLDNFKALNDTQGHGAGDQLLKEVAARLIGCVRAEDTVARLGGDEFVVLLEMAGPQATHPMVQAETVGRKILERLGQPYPLPGGSHVCTPSVGVALADTASTDAHAVLQQADMAMYQSKAAGRNTIRFFDPALQSVADRKAEMDQDLRAALERHEFSPLLKPQVDVRGVVQGAKLTLRWQHPTQGVIKPSGFVAQAEENGLIVPIGLWALESACWTLARWSRDPATAAWTLSVNASARHLRQPDFAASVLAILARTRADATRLHLELTENTLTTLTPAMLEAMQQLRDRGVRFSLDNFGTGYSSLSRLKRLPIDAIKIDPSFIHDLETDDDAAAVVRTILALGNSLGLTTVADGVETPVQHGMLVAMGCSRFQGPMFGEPVPPERALAHWQSLAPHAG